MLDGNESINSDLSQRLQNLTKNQHKKVDFKRLIEVISLEYEDLKSISQIMEISLKENLDNELGRVK